MSSATSPSVIDDCGVTILLLLGCYQGFLHVEPAELSLESSSPSLLSSFAYIEQEYLYTYSLSLFFVKSIPIYILGSHPLHCALT